MPYAAIDVGSITFRLVVGDISNGKVQPIRYDRAITRLAEGLGSSGLLTDSAMDRSIEALIVFADVTTTYRIEERRCIGTSALREAENAQIFIEKARDETGLAIDVISGQKEAELTAKGVLSSFETVESGFIVDIGGGSTEAVLTRGGTVTAWASIEAGVVRMLEKHVYSDPPDEGEVEALKDEANETASALVRALGQTPPDGSVLFGTGGTVTTLAAIELALDEYVPTAVHGHRVSHADLRDMSKKMCSISRSERASLKGLETERADLIIPGIILTISLMEALNYNEIMVSNHGLLEGALLELAEESENRSL